MSTTQTNAETWGLYHVNTRDGTTLRFKHCGRLTREEAESRAKELRLGQARGTAYSRGDDWDVRAMRDQEGGAR